MVTGYTQNYTIYFLSCSENTLQYIYAVTVQLYAKVRPLFFFIQYLFYCMLSLSDSNPPFTRSRNPDYTRVLAFTRAH